MHAASATEYSFPYARRTASRFDRTLLVMADWFSGILSNRTLYTGNEAKPTTSANTLTEQSSKEELLAEIQRLRFLLGDKSAFSLYDGHTAFELENLAGETVNIERYKGKPMLIVNVASL